MTDDRDRGVGLGLPSGWAPSPPDVLARAPDGPTIFENFRRRQRRLGRRGRFAGDKDATVLGAMGPTPTPPRKLTVARPIVRDQGSVPCCVSIAIVTAMEILSANAWPPLSPLYNYYQSRAIKGQLGPVPFSTAITEAATGGVCPQTDHPANAALDMTIAGALTPPSSSAQSAAGQHRLWSFDTPIDPNAAGMPLHYPLPAPCEHDLWKAGLMAGAVIVVGLNVTSAYDRAASPPYVHDRPFDTTTSQHAVIVVGYDDDRSVFEIGDSRGPGYADSGRWWLTYEAAEDVALVQEAWLIAAPSR